MKRLQVLRRIVSGSLCILLMLVASLVHAQSLRVGGTVRDAHTGETLAGAQVRVQGRLRGAIADGQGAFSLEIDAAAQTLEVSHIGYKSAYLPLRGAAGHKLEVRLEPAAALAPVEITAGPEPVFEDKTIHLYDYEFFEGQLMVILYDRELRQGKLALVDAQDSILDTDLCVEKPGKLVRDCLGHVHAITTHHACQIYLEGNEIAYYVDSLATFQRTVEPVLGNIDNYYYFDYRRFNNQIVDYLAYDMDQDHWEPFLQVKDKVKMHQLMDPLGIYMGVATSEAEMLSLTPEDWEKVGKLDAEFQFEQMAFFYPVFAPLHIIDRQVMVFDHLNGLLRKFEKDGTPAGEVEIGYHKLPGWQRNIIVDEVRGEAYATYARHGYTSLRKIDLQTGEVGMPIEIPKQFANKLMVRDGVAYFMYKQGIYDDTNRLYRMAL